MHKKGLTTFLTFTMFFIMGLTGIVLYFTPAGRVAYWIDWHFIGLTKTQWGNIHIVSSILFTAAAIYHLVLNWRVFTSYIVDKARDALRLKREMAVSLVLMTAVFAGSAADVQPMSLIVDLGEYLKAMWVTEKDFEPPFGHAELVSLKVLSIRMDLDLERAEVLLAEEGVTYESADSKIIDIARTNRMTPLEIYRIVRVAKKAPEPIRYGALTPDEVEARFAGTGLGRKELAWILKEHAVDAKKAFERLAAKGITVPNGVTLKEISDQLGVDPIEILKAALIDEYVPATED
jgi:hypothetical protein